MEAPSVLVKSDPPRRQGALGVASARHFTYDGVMGETSSQQAQSLQGLQTSPVAGGLRVRGPIRGLQLPGGLQRQRLRLWSDGCWEDAHHAGDLKRSPKAIKL